MKRSELFDDNLIKIIGLSLETKRKICLWSFNTSVIKKPSTFYGLMNIILWVSYLD